mmetsp:Transcript_44504/g.102866  ORF Transcript_44504/g.102866 Transcript_44504/m.102866 type:complete len:287 (+) Transcript_44504:840-1700(+)
MRAVLLALLLLAGGVDDARGLHLKLDDTVHHEVPIARILVVADGVNRRDDEAACTAHLRRPAEVRVLPEEAHVLLVDAHGILDAPRLALGGGDPGVQVLDRALAVTAELELIGIDTEAHLANVEDALPRVRVLHAAVRHNHLSDARAVAHGAPVIADAAEDHALAVAEANMHLPLVPLEYAVLEAERHALWLRNDQGLERVVAETLVGLGAVVHRVFRHRCDEAVGDLQDRRGDAVEDQREAFHGVGVVVVETVQALPKVDKHRRLALNHLRRQAGSGAHWPGLDV